MGVEVLYDGSPLTTVRRSSARLQEVAEMGRIGQSTVLIENSAGTLEIIGHKTFRVNEDDCSDPKVLRGFMGERGYKREMMRTGSQRVIEPNVYDLNAKFGFKVIRGREWRKRPKNDTIALRLADLLDSGFLGLIDAGFVEYPDIDLERADLRGQRPGDVLMDMATRAGFNFFAYWDDYEDAAALWFQDSNTSTDWNSDLRISNVIADLDTHTVATFGTGTTFAASKDTVLTRSPAQTVSGVWMPFKKGNVYRTRAATEETFEPRDGTAPNANAGKRARARNIADRFLFHHRNEEDRIITTIQLPADKVNLVRAGQRIECKFSDYATEGYGGFVWFRVLQRDIVVPTAPDHDRYTLTLTLSPQEEAETVAEMVQCASTSSAAETTVTLDSDVTVGNLLVSRLITRNSDTIPAMFDGSWTFLGGGTAANGGGSNPRGAVAMYAKIADSTSPIIGREASANQMQMTVCEISGKGLDDITAFSTPADMTGSTWNPGSGSGTIGLFVVAVPRGSDQDGQGYVITPTGAWTVEKNQDIDNAPACSFGPADPWWWAAKIENQTNVSLAISIAVEDCLSIQFLNEWCAVAMFV